MTCGAHGTQEFALKTVRIRITYILNRLGNPEETAMPWTKLSPKSIPFPKIWVLLSSELWGGDSSFTCVLSAALKTRVFQRQTMRIITVPQEQLKTLSTGYGPSRDPGPRHEKCEILS